MKSNREYTDYLQDILDAAGKAMRFVKGVDFEAFCANEEKVFAVIRALEIIGEAAKNITKSMRGRYAEIPWEDIVGMRNKVIHDYFGVDLEVIWKTLHEDLPPLQAAIAKILKDLKKGHNS
ncbi:MAG: DUF86 domain-containing protein [Deltaproteobacteria bacterium CG_4_8_14_3_um_filter_45_9]|jgi:uncharacterized protein with HEPN domain|nr:MAG: DUF86 domain-containing protein [Deltaproteobacteria bacterium CG03_land_8_20_14_0_80_45_14]PIX25379.1 MAG: DUF86 domain-containing protein [Deltaproteobacteria bacterium CG_4_8_14_3_um_filter_45_9]